MPSGAQSLKIASTDTAGNNRRVPETRTSAPSSPPTSTCVSICSCPPAMRRPATSGGVTRRIVRFYTDVTTGGVYAVMSLCVNAAGTTTSLLFQDVNPSNSWAGSGSINLTENQWHFIEFHVGPVGVSSTPAQFWVDSVSIGAWSSTAFTSASSFNYIQWGDVATGSSTHFMPGTSYWDDLVISNA